MVWYFIAYCVGLLTAFAFADNVKDFVWRRRNRRQSPIISPITVRFRDGHEVPLTIRKDWK